MRKKVATRRSSLPNRPLRNPPSKNQSHPHIHIHSHSFSLSSPTPETTARTKITTRRPSTIPSDAGTFRVNMANKPMTEEKPPRSPPP
ncbi:hypothetical protein AHAS_Ahas07G0091600 [Arachis hypogaea]